MTNFLASILEKMAAWLKTPSQQGGELEKEESLSPQIPEKSIGSLEDEVSSPQVIEEILSHSLPKKSLEKEIQDVNVVEDVFSSDVCENRKKHKKKNTEILSSIQKYPIRDAMNLMDTPFLALSKNRKKPISYESHDGTRKTRISAHSECFIASVYDWDIILFVAGRIQDIFNKRADVPPRSIIIPRHEILKALHKHNVNTQQKELEKSLHRLKRTAIDTTICNEDGRYKSDFGFLDSWEYTERKDKKEMKITLSQWLYDLICAEGALLKINPAYFDITSGLKKFLYRTARKCVGHQESWELALKTLYEKSGSEQELRKFKNDLKSAVSDNDLPEYTLKWVVKDKQTSVVFRKRLKIDEINSLVEKFENSNEMSDTPHTLA